MTGKHDVIDMVRNETHYEVHVAWECRWRKDGSTTMDVDAKVMVAQTSWGPPDSYGPGKSEAMSGMAGLEGPPWRYLVLYSCEEFSSPLGPNARPLLPRLQP